MNAIEALNNWGTSFLNFALPMFLQSSLLIIVLFALDWFIRKRARAVFRYGLWMLVPIKLLLPPSLALPTGLAYWLPVKESVQAHTVVPARISVQYSNVKFDEMPVLPTTPLPRPTLRLSAWLLLGWLTIAVGLMAWLARRSRRIAASTGQAIPARNTQILDACRRQLGIRRIIRVKLSATVSSPAVYGFWRPIILIPQRLATQLSALQLRAVLLHELAHIRRGDVLAHYAQTLLQILYWWHPLLWLANARIRRVREQAVDETVMVEMGGEAEAYPATLLEVAKLTFQRPALLLGLIGIVESRSALSQRVKHLLERPVPKSAKMGFARLALVFLAGALLLPMARAQRKPDAGAVVQSDPLDDLAVVDLDVQIVTIADTGPGNPGLGKPTLAGSNGHLAWVLSSGQREEYLRSIDRESVVRSAPTITTISGREARVEIGGIEPFKHPQAQATASCQITPALRGTAIDLSVSATITESGEVDSGIADDPTAGQDQRAHENQSGQAVAANGIGSINYDVGALQISVSDGDCVVLENPGLTGAGGKRMLVVVSPRVIRPSLPVAAAKRASPNASEVSRAENNALPAAGTKSTSSQTPDATPAESASKSAREALTVTITKAEPRFHLGTKPVSLEAVAEIGESVDSTESARTRLAELISQYEAGHPKFREQRDKSRKLETEQFADRRLPVAWIVDVVGNTQAPLPNLPHGLPTDVFLDYLPVGLGGVERALARIASSPTDNHVWIRLGREAPSELIVQMLEAVEKTGLRRFDLAIREGTLADFAAAISQRRAVPNFGGDMPSLGSVFLDSHIEQKLQPTKKRNPDNPDAALDQSRLETRTFKVDPNVFQQGFALPLGSQIQSTTGGADFDIPRIFVPGASQGGGDSTGATRTNLTQSAQDTVRSFFTAAGVNVLPPNMIFFNDRTGLLMVRATAGELDRVQKMIDGLNDVRGNNASAKPRANSANSGRTAKTDAANDPGTDAESKHKATPEAKRPEPGHSSEILENRIFRVNPGAFLEGVGWVQGVPHDTGTTRLIPEIQEAVSNFFATAGVNFQPPNMLFFDQRTGVLMVRASEEELDLVQKAIEVFTVAPPLVTIEVKFMEMPTDAARKLGFELPPPGEVSNAWARILTAAQARTFLQGAEQRHGVHLLALPTVTTVSGRQTQIQTIQIQTTVSGFKSEDLKALAFDWYLGDFLMSNGGAGVKGGTAPPGVRSANGIQAQHYVTSRVPVGPRLDLIPHVETDGCTIHLTALPQVNEFLGYDTTVIGADDAFVWIDGDKQKAPMPLPSYRTRFIHAAADVYDGQTLVLANPQVTAVSELPNGDSVTNAIPEDPGRRLLVFITPTIIDPAGNPIHTPGKEPFPADKIPPQAYR
jgi:beta-lactamase regulating signal transducer with metallopeptidase domain